MVEHTYIYSWTDNSICKDGFVSKNKLLQCPENIPNSARAKYDKASNIYIALHLKINKVD